MIDKYWALYTDEIDGFDNGAMVAGTAWPVNLQPTSSSAPRCRRSSPTEGRDGVGRHLDDVDATRRTRTACSSG